MSKPFVASWQFWAGVLSTVSTLALAILLVG
jgi:hypothetical protein